MSSLGTGSAASRSPLDWHNIDLVVFDVDGTLYDQRPLRLAMFKALLADAWRGRSLQTLQVLRTFRHVREALGEEPAADFAVEQHARTAARHGLTAAEVQALTAEWLERRPLPFLAACRYPHLDRLFAALHAAGKQVAAWSDYPARDKLAALGLQASPVVCATDSDIARLKPDPAGLLEVLRRTGVPAHRALMVGDRIDRDAAAAQRVGVRALIRGVPSSAEVEGFAAYNDPVFQPVLQGLAPAAAASAATRAAAA